LFQAIEIFDGLKILPVIRKKSRLTILCKTGFFYVVKVLLV